MHSQYAQDAAARALADRAAHVSEALALRTYTARLLGAETSLVLHGGGNTSVKEDATTDLGETVRVLYVKGSGWDLATIEPAGHPAVRMDALEKLLAFEAMTDEQMVNGLRLALLDANAPTPSVETLLHAALPALYIDHTHADAVLAIADQKNGESICRELYGDALLWIPYVMPGFGLARACKTAWEERDRTKPDPTIMVLDRHGVFTFGDTAQQSYERMIAAVTRAEQHTADRMSTMNVPPVERDDRLAGRVAAVVRGAWATVSGEVLERGPVVAVRTSELILSFLERRDVDELTQRGCATPDHVLRTKPFPLVVSKPALGDLVAFASRMDREIARYSKTYDVYFADQSAKKHVSPKKLDPWPRIILVPKIGILAIGKTKKEAVIAADIYEHTIQVITDAEAVGSYAPAGRNDLFDVEYWSLEQAKLKHVAELPLARSVAVITGAANGIGKATAKHFLALGAHVMLGDRDHGALEAAAKELGGDRVAFSECDVTDRAAVENLFHLASLSFGGVDIVVSNAGIACEGHLDTDEGAAALRRSMDVNFFAHNMVASAACEVFHLQRRGGCLLFNASKSAFAPGPGFGPYAVAKAALIGLMRQYALDQARHGVRSNAVNADRVRTGIFADGLLESRAAARSISVDDYFRSNLLAREVSAFDVAQSFGYLAQAKATTGCVITVDGGNAAAFPR